MHIRRHSHENGNPDKNISGFSRNVTGPRTRRWRIKSGMTIIFLLLLILPLHTTRAAQFSPEEIQQLKTVDSDHDGLSDYDEIFIFPTDPHNPDTDGDGYSDGDEVKHGYDPLNKDPNKKLVKSIEIDLKRQRMRKILGPLILAEYPISTGKWNTPTPKGTFAIRNKTPRAWSKQFGLYMPWWMEFTSQGHGIHELPEWPNGYKEGQNHLGTPVSHGCVRLGIGPAKEMYDWAPIGTPVVVR